jgi:predicted NUDIX family phosphoesterase
MKNEFILAYPKHNLLRDIQASPPIDLVVYEKAKLFAFTKPHENGFEAFARVFDGLTQDAVFARREELEKSPTMIHPIPYIVFEREDNSVYLYQRGKESGEGRLAGDESIAPGGHVEIDDAVNGIPFVPYLHAYGAALDYWKEYGKDLQAMITAVFREVHEEVDLVPVVNKGFINLDAGFGFEFIGALYDETNEVGTVHLGLVFKVKIPNTMNVVSKESVIIDRGFFLPEELLNEDSKGLIKLENWSKVVAAHLFNQRCLKATRA